MRSAARLVLFVVLAALAQTGAALAQMDLSGSWASRLHEDWIERRPGPEAVDYLGIPINDEARQRALSYSSSQLSEPERQCLPYGAYYTELGPFGVDIWSEDEPVTGRLVAWKISASIDRAMRVIWMDGRPHPSKYAMHTFGGFSTGVWEGDILVVTTTHMKAGYLRRNGVPASDEATMTERFARHGDLLTVAAFIEDPAYLTEPYVLSRAWQLDPRAPQNRIPGPCFPVVEVARLGTAGAVPHYLPGENPYLREVSDMYNLPLEAVMSGAQTLYPEYRKVLKGHYTMPKACTRYCCGWGASGTGPDSPGLEGSGCVNRSPK
jgi:hypothetical protein